MERYNQLAIAYMKSNKKKTAMTTAGIALAVALLFSVITIFISLWSTLIASVRTTANYEIYYSDVDAATYKKINNDEKTEDTLLVEEYKYAGELDEYVGYEIHAYGDFNQTIFQISLHEDTGRYPENANEIIVPDFALKKMNWEIGDTITLIEKNAQYNEETKEMELEEEKREWVIVGSYSMENIDAENYYNYTFYTLIDREQQPPYCSLYVKVKKPFQMKKIMETFEKEYEAYGELNYELGFYYVQDPDDLSFLVVLVLGAFLVYFMLFVAVMIIRNAFVISVVERTKDYGILRCIGASKKQLYKLLVTESSLMGIGAYGLGVLVSILILYSSVFLVRNWLSSFRLGSLFKIRLSPAAFILTGLFTAGAIMFSMIEPARQAGLASPIEAVHDSLKVKKEKRIRKRNGKLFGLLFGIEGEYAYKNVMRSKSKFISTIVGIVISVTIFVGFHGVYGAIIHLCEIDLEGLERDCEIQVANMDFLIKDTQIDVMDYYEEIMSVNGVTNVIPVYETTVINGDSRVTNAKTQEECRYYTLTGLTKDQLEALTPALAEGSLDEEALGENGVILVNYYKEYDGSLIKLTDVQVGDTICIPDYYAMDAYIRTFDNEYWKYINEIKAYANELVDQGDCTEVTVAAIVTENLAYGLGSVVQGNATVIMPMEQYLDMTGNDFCETMLVDVENDNVISDLAQTVSNYSELSFDDLKEVYRAMLATLNFVKIIIYGVMVVITGICMIQIMITLNSNMIIRKREFATLGAIGMTKKQINKMLTIEGGLASIIGSVLGSVLGISFSYIMVKLISERSEFYYKIPIGSIMIALSLAMILNITATVTSKKES